MVSVKTEDEMAKREYFMRRSKFSLMDGSEKIAPETKQPNDTNKAKKSNLSIELKKVMFPLDFLFEFSRSLLGLDCFLMAK